MKLSKSIMSSLFLILLTIFITSCNDDDSSDSETTEETEVTEEEAIEIIETSLQSNTGGLAETAETYSENLHKYYLLQEDCDVLYEKSFPFTYNGPRIETDYEINWSYEFSCNSEDEATSVQFTSNSNGSYSTEAISAEDITESSLSIAGLDSGSDELIYNGSYSREGDQTISIGLGSRDISSALSLNLDKLVVNKSDYRIDSGEATMLLTVVNLNNTTTFEGSITFNGNGSATIVINGAEYEIDCN